MRRTVLMCGVVVVLALTTSPAIARPLRAALAAPTYVNARTSFGQPDLEGMWSANFLLTFEVSADAPRLIASEAAAKRLAASRTKAVDAFFGKLDPEVPTLLEGVDGLPLVRGGRRTRLVTAPADGRLPYTAAARKELEDGPGEPKFDNPEDRPSTERCLVGDGQPPFTTLTFGDQLQILQTRDHVILHSEYGDDVRIIPFANKHRPAVFRSRLGDSIARWEGNTLVIETVRLPNADRYRLLPALIVSGDSTVIERLTRVSPRELLYQFTVIDPKVFSGPWSAEFSWYATHHRMFEHACHEGNYSLPGILGGARHDESIAVRAKSPPE